MKNLLNPHLSLAYIIVITKIIQHFEIKLISTRNVIEDK